MAKAAKKAETKAETTDLRTVFAACVLFRVVNALCVRTFFSADEYWQSVEVAHKLVFGYGHLTWEWSHGLRGYLHPLKFFRNPYKIAQTIGLDSTAVTVWSPRIVQAVIAAAGDIHVYKLAHRWFAGAKRKAKAEKSEGAAEPDAAARWRCLLPRVLVQLLLRGQDLLQLHRGGAHRRGARVLAVDRRRVRERRRQERQATSLARARRRRVCRSSSRRALLAPDVRGGVRQVGEPGTFHS